MTEETKKKSINGQENEGKKAPERETSSNSTLEIEEAKKKKKNSRVCFLTGRKITILTVLRAFFLVVILFLLFSLFRGSWHASRWFSPKGDRSFYQNQGKAKNDQKKNSLLSDQNTLSDQVEENTVVTAVEKASPAVVSIIITKDMPKIQNFFFDPFSGGNSGFPGDPSFFDQFFGQGNGSNVPNQPQNNGGTVKQEIGGGTGFVVSEDGLIVTNKHVVSDQEAEYTVLTNDGREYDATVLGRDRTNDVAVIKIDPSKPKKGNAVDKMETLSLGDSTQIKIGQTAIAIGNALGEFSNTVSKGIISGLKRNIVAGGQSGAEQLDQLIQTDAAINEGNSGGPLLNLKGEVIGINVAIAQGAQNIGFAIPINMVKNTIQSVKDNGKIVQPYLGVRYQLINKAIQDSNNLPFDYGALVVRGQNVTDLAVIPGSSADKAGIVENDIILEINGTKIDDKNQPARVIANFSVGQEIELKIWHKGETKMIKLTLQEAPVK